MNYDDFFAAATQGLSPFPYQRSVAEDAQFPWFIDVPTGAGKTAAVVLGWLWRRRHHPLDSVKQNTPRRLAYCLPMRVLVEQTVEAARAWLANLDLLAEMPDHPGRVSVHQLMGGEVQKDWDAWPEADAILVGTQDQLLSRALNRGYALSRYRWPMQFGLLNSDCLWVMDEVQLMGPGLTTTLQLQALRERLQTDGPAASLWMSATIQPARMSTVDGPPATSFAERTLTISLDDAEHLSLSTRLTATKPLAYSGLSLSKETKAGHARAIAEQVLEAHRANSLTLVILNQVARAQAVATALGKAGTSGEVILLHSRFRPPERQVLQSRLASPLPPEGRIVVATQTVEAGVDISARVLFTELAPWASLVQRFGRCNRRGEWAAADGCQVRWMDLDAETEGAPYVPGDLAASREALSGLTDVGIEALRQFTDHSAPAPTQVLRRKDLLDLFDTTSDLAGNDVDVSPYIRDAEDLDVSVLWRDLSDEQGMAMAPAPHELCPVSVTRFREFLPTLQKRQAWPRVWDGLSEGWIALRPDSLRPGLVLLIDTQGGGYDPTLGWWPDAEVVAPVSPLSEEQGNLSNDGYGDDQMSMVGTFVSLSQHLTDAAAALESLVSLSAPDEAVLAALRKAALWHDVGKAHPHFQDRLLQALAPDDPRRSEGPWAKSEYSSAGHEKDTERPHFRHELASALSLLEHGGDDLTAYLVASHHGKVRLSLRSLPGERLPGDDRQFARGVWDGDVLPPVTLGDGTVVPETTLSLRLMQLGASETGLSWLERMLALRDRYGPFRLAYLEALLRVADWRASAKEREIDA